MSRVLLHQVCPAMLCSQPPYYCVLLFVSDCLSALLRSAIPPFPHEQCLISVRARAHDVLHHLHCCTTRPCSADVSHNSLPQSTSPIRLPSCIIYTAVTLYCSMLMFPTCLSHTNNNNDACFSCKEIHLASEPQVVTILFIWHCELLETNILFQSFHCILAMKRFTKFMP